MAASPTFDPELAYPSYDKPFLESWNGRFEAVLVVLHPFFTLPDVQPVQDGFVVTPHARSVSGRTAFHRAEEREIPESNTALANLRKGGSLIASIGQPDGLDWVDDATPLSWNSIAAEAGLGDSGRVGAALAALIGGLKKEYVVSSDVERLASYSETEAVFLPTEGSFQPMLLQPLADLLSDDPSIIYQAEFDSDPVRVLSKADVVAGAPWRGSLYNPTKTRLAVVDWDSHFMLAAGPRRDLERWSSEQSLDAFFADETTRHPWWFHPTNLN